MPIVPPTPQAGAPWGVQPLPSGQKPSFLVLVDGRPACGPLIRAACALAAVQGAPWVGAYLDVTGRLFYSQAEERRLSEHLRQVERLGGDLVCCGAPGGHPGRALLNQARLRGVTDLVLGRGGSWRDRFRPSLVDELARGDLDLVIHLLPSCDGPSEPMPAAPSPVLPGLRQTGWVLALLAAATGLGYLVFHLLGLADVMMAYMLCITIAATRLDRLATLLMSVLSILTLDFCFIEPRYTFVLTDIQHIGTFAVMLGVGWVILNLAENIRTKTRLAQERERHTRTLYRVGSVLAEGGSMAALQARAEAYLGRELELPVAILLCDAEGRLPVTASADPRLDPEVLNLIQATLASGAPSGQGSEVAAQSRFSVLPLPGTERLLGVLVLLPAEGSPRVEPGRLDLLPPVAAQLSLALERARLAEERTEARIRADHEELRSSLLSSVSHDLRSPLGTITGATTTLLDPGPEATPGDQKILLNTIHQEAQRLLRMVNNLLAITKLESGHLQVKKEWVAIEEVVGSAISHLEEQFEGRALAVALPEIWVPMDPVLFEQALLNLLDNAVKYSPPGTPIELKGWVEGRDFRLRVADQGPGLAEGEERLIFQKLYRGASSTAAPGAGLGLAIVQGIILAHGGTIQAGTGARGGAEFTLTLALEAPALAGPPPEPKLEISF